MTTSKPNIFKNYKLFEIFVLSIMSGMPFSIILTCIITWLKESDVPLQIATTFVFAKVFYSLKFIWAPLVDYIKLPLIGNIGRRKSWLALCTSLIACILVIFSFIDVKNNLPIVYVLSLALGFLSSTYDINIDAFRIDTVEPQFQGIGSANAVLGYRIGMLIVSAGSFYLVDVTHSWQHAFLALSFIFIIGTLYIFSIKENSVIDNRSDLKNQKLSYLYIRNIVKTVVIEPFHDFLKKEKSIVILVAILTFKLGDAMLGVVSNPFYLELGYTKSQIASIVKLYGFVSSLLGVYAGGLLIYKFGNIKSLIITGIAQSITNLIYIWLSHQHGNFEALFYSISIENFTGGMGNASLIAYLSFLCNKNYSATQYALLSSTATFCNSTITAFGGELAAKLGWSKYFEMTCYLGFPSVLIFIYLNFALKKTSN